MLYYIFNFLCLYVLVYVSIRSNGLAQMSMCSTICSSVCVYMLYNVCFFVLACMSICPSMCVYI